MLKQLRNLVFHDVPPEQDILLSPGDYLKKLLLDDDNGIDLIPNKAVMPTSQVVDDLHPLGLGNPKILHVIFNHLSIPELFRMRLVNLRWNVIACEVLRKKLGYFKIRPSEMKSFIKLMRNNIINPICSYAIRIDRIQDLATIKFINRFCLDITYIRVRLNIKEMLGFAKSLQKMKNLKHLHILVFDEQHNHGSLLILSDIYMGPTSRGASPRLMDENSAWALGLYSFEKVDTLIFENCDPSYKIHGFYDNTVSHMINACKHLRSLRLIHWNSPLGKIFCKLGIEAPGVLDTFGKSAKVQDLTSIFFNTNLKFHVVRLEVTPQVTFELVGDLIHQSVDSLQDLSVVNENIFETFKVSSVLRNVKRLRLNLWLGPVEFSYMARQFPVLRVLSLNLSNLYEVEHSSAVLFEPCTSLRTLILTRLESGIDDALMGKLARMFPNVTELFVEVNNGSALQKIYELYPDLTLLSLELNLGNGSEPEDDHDSILLMDNESFTGVPDDLVHVVYFRECGCPVVEFPEEARKCWNIGCLKNLTTLLLRLPNSVDNIALLEGISRLEKLENLLLLPMNYNNEEPTKWCLRSIADNFHRLKTLFTSTEITYSENDLRYLFKKLPKLVHRKKL